MYVIGIISDWHGFSIIDVLLVKASDIYIGRHIHSLDRREIIFIILTISDSRIKYYILKLR